MLPGLNLLPGENLHSGANCAHEQRLSLSYNYLAGSLINASFLTGVSLEFSMEFHQCDWSIVYMDCLSVLISLAL